MTEEAVRNAKRFGDICPICKERKASQIHHIIGQTKKNRALCEKYSKVMLIWICEPCHTEIHHTGSNGSKYESLMWKTRAYAQREWQAVYPDVDWFSVWGKNYDWILEGEK